MARYVPGVGTFDPDLPEWLILHTDGKLYNLNATNNQVRLTEPWTPPEGWRGDGTTILFTPEGEPAPEPEPPPAPPAQGGVSPVLMYRLIGAMRALIAHDNELLALAQQRVADDSARMQEGLRLAVEADAAFDAVLADLQKQVNVK